MKYLTRNRLRNPHFLFESGADQVSLEGIPGWTLGRNHRSKIPPEEGVLSRFAPAVPPAPGRERDIFALRVVEASDAEELALVRQELAVDTGDLRQPIDLRIRLYSASERSFRLYLALVGQTTGRRVARLKVKKSICGWDEIDLKATFWPLPLNVRDTFRLVVQLGAALEPGDVVGLAEAELLVAPSEHAVRPIRFRFDAFGGFDKASARLRVHRHLDALMAAGHEVSLGEGDDCDVYVCQKVRPFGTIRTWKGQRPLIVFDFDDNYFVSEQGSDSSLYAFLNTADMVTVGSEELLKRAELHHPNVHLLENPADILDDHVVRAPTERLRALGWFGAPENLHQLDVLPADLEVRTVTRGGDIEFDIGTVDEVLTSRFDLLVFPVSADEWAVSKNANRLVKAVALGIPVLASATSEHIKAAELLGLDQRFLVRHGDDWAAKIDALKRDFAQVQRDVLEARNRALEIYAPEAILDGWLDRVLTLRPRAEAGARCLPPTKAPRSLAAVDVLVDDVSAESRFLQTVQTSEVNWSLFGRRTVLALAPPGNARFQARAFECIGAEDDIQGVYARFGEELAKGAGEYVLYVPAGYKLVYGFERILDEQLRSGAEVAIFRGHEYSAPPDDILDSKDALRSGFWQPRLPGVMLLHRRWLAEQAISPWDAMSYWPWAVNICAILSETPISVPRPVCTQRSRTRDIENMSRAHAGFVETMWPKGKTYSLPDPNEQWMRVSFGIIQALAKRHSAALPWLVAAGFQQSLRQGGEVERLNRELRRAAATMKLLSNAGGDLEHVQDVGNDRQVSLARGP